MLCSVFILLAEHREEGERGRKAFLRCPQSSESREGETLGGLRGCQSACLGNTVVPHAPPPCGFLKLTQPPPWGAGPFFPSSWASSQRRILLSLGNSCHFIIVCYTYFPHLPQKKEVFKFIFRDLPNTGCMFRLSKLAPSSEQTPGLEERKDEDIALLKESSRLGAAGRGVGGSLNLLLYK